MSDDIVKLRAEIQRLEQRILELESTVASLDDDRYDEIENLRESLAAYEGQVGP